MPASKTRHWNTPKHDGKTRCGRHLSQVEWRNDINDVDCNKCLQLYGLDLKDMDAQSAYSESNAGFTETPT